MTGRRRVAAALGAALLTAGPAAAQSFDPGPPGPYVVDARGLLSGLPDVSHLLVSAPTDAVAPGRGLGVEIGAHVYPLSLGPSRIGLGAGVVRVSGRATPAMAGAEDGAAVVFGLPEVATTLTLVAPQVSFNFGSGDGWSYISAGWGWGRLSAALAAPGVDVDDSSGWGAALNYGAGARWFLNPHLAVGFDLRVHQLQGRAIATGIGIQPRSTLTAVNVGISIR